MMHYYQHHIGDYRRDTSHLSLLEHGVYRQLLDLYHLSEKPIPEETDWVIRRLAAKTELEISAIKLVLSDFFVLNADGALGYSHKRCDKDIEDYANKADTARVNGKLGGRPKKTQPVIYGNPEEPTSQANHEPLTINQEPVEKKQRGSRLPNKIENIQEWIDFCNKERPDLTAHAVYSQFRDYWIAKAGSGGVKLDWFATWRNWVRSQSAPKQFNNFAQVKADVAKSTVIESADYAATKRREAEEDAIPKNGPSLETLAKMAAIRAKARAVEI